MYLLGLIPMLLSVIFASQLWSVKNRQNYLMDTLNDSELLSKFLTDEDFISSCKEVRSSGIYANFSKINSETKLHITEDSDNSANRKIVIIYGVLILACYYLCYISSPYILLAALVFGFLMKRRNIPKEAVKSALNYLQDLIILMQDWINDDVISFKNWITKNPKYATLAKILLKSS